ncbi:hypothetical protein Ahia01_000834400 [Argonauta hians]
MDPNLLAPIKNLSKMSTSRRRTSSNNNLLNAVTTLKKPKKEHDPSSDYKEQGFYSEVVAKNTLKSKPRVFEPELIHPNTLWQIPKIKYTPPVASCNLSHEAVMANLTGDIYEKTTAPTSKSDFPWVSYEAKVQLPYFTPIGKCPRKIEIERRRRLYASLDLTELLSEEGVSGVELIPIDIFNPEAVKEKEEQGTPFPTYLLLQTFDNEDYDCRTPYEWIRMGQEDNILKPVPGIAFLPNKPTDESSTSSEGTHSWRSVGVIGYKPSTKEYLVQEVNSEGRLIDDEGNLVVGYENSEDVTLVEDQYWIPRIYLMFRAEDPRIFAKRISEAVRQRKATEALLRYHLYVDCMPMDGVGELDQTSLKRMIDWAKNTVGIRKDKL